MYLNPVLVKSVTHVRKQASIISYVTRKVLFIFLNSRSYYSNSNLVVKVSIIRHVISSKLLRERWETRACYGKHV